ncbi:MAG: hypothetical protein U1E22_06570, partial [Coriobacteriia bacterium]|nr:hypothetical protein [Coriobacteriia bacterium]
MSFDLDGGGWIENDHRRIQLNDVSAVWYRRALSPPSSLTVSQEDAGFARTESRHFLEGALLSLNVPWVNHPLATQLAERKLRVLRLAQESGLSVPPSMASNDADALAAFAEVHPDLVVKPVYSGLQMTPEGDYYSIYASQFDHALLADHQAIEACPTFLQARVEKIEDLRVTFFGDTFFAVSIHADGELDWRVPNARLRYEVIRLDDSVASSCLALMSSLGISYGAFDFARTAEG